MSNFNIKTYLILKTKQSSFEFKVFYFLCNPSLYVLAFALKIYYLVKILTRSLKMVIKTIEPDCF